MPPLDARVQPQAGPVEEAAATATEAADAATIATAATTATAAAADDTDTRVQKNGFWGLMVANSPLRVSPLGGGPQPIMVSTYPPPCIPVVDQATVWGGLEAAKEALKSIENGTHVGKQVIKIG